MKDNFNPGVRLQEAVHRCLFCYEPPCTKACPHGCDAAGLIFSVKMLDFQGAKECTRGVTEKTVEACHGACMKACVRQSLDRAVNIRGAHLDFLAWAKEGEGHEE